MLDESSPPEPRVETADGATVPWTGWDLVASMCVGLALGVGAAFAVVLALRGVGADLSDTTIYSVASVVIYAGFALAAWGFALRRRAATFRDAGFRWVGIGPLILAFPLVGLLIFATFVILALTTAVVGDVPTAREQVVPGETSLLPVDLVWLLLAAAVAAPIVEEFFFRGLLFPYLRARRGLVFAVMVSAALFSVVHFVPPLIPALFVFGIVQALVAYRLKSIYPAIVMHAFNNAVLLLFVYASLGET